MRVSHLHKLAQLIHDESDTVLAQWRERVGRLPSAQNFDTLALEDHVPALLDELSSALRTASAEAVERALPHGSPPLHGIHRYKQGFDLVEVVAEYNILRACIHDLAEQHGLPIKGEAYHVLNRVLDDAIGLAAQTFATQQALEVQKQRDDHLRFLAHDLRTPLSSILLTAETLQRTLPEGRAEQAGQMLQVLQRNAHHLLDLVEGALKESDRNGTRSATRVEPSDFLLWQLVQDVLTDTQPLAATASTTLSNRVPTTLTAYADTGMLRRVLQNLLANAIRHTPRGEITIEARAADQAGAIECSIRDNGTGIPSDRLDKIFDQPANDQEREGFGVGLSIVRTFVEAHGGRVSAESKEGAGSVFRIWLPGKGKSPQAPGRGAT